MVRSEESDSGVDESENEISEEETAEPCGGVQKREKISEYEKQRLSRIAENKVRMEALGISKLASALIGLPQSSSKRKGKRKVFGNDEDYKPNNDDDCLDDDTDNDDEDLDEDEEFLGSKASRSRKTKVKKKGLTPTKKVPTKRQVHSSDYVDEDDDELMQAIVLSLQDSAKVPGSVLDETKGNEHVKEATGRGKRKKRFTSRVQMTEDEVILHFFQLDEAGKGGINKRDLRRIAIEHDFIWSDQELADMIRLFDGDGDEKLNLDDFRKIVSRCNMIQASESSW